MMPLFRVLFAEEKFSRLRLGTAGPCIKILDGAF